MSLAEKTPLLKASVTPTTSAAATMSEPTTSQSATTTASGAAFSSSTSASSSTIATITSAPINPTSLAASAQNLSKKKEPPILERSVTIANPHVVDQKGLLSKLLTRSQTLLAKWKKRASFFKCAHFLVIMLLLALQVTEIIIFQMPTVGNRARTTIATIFPAVTGAILAIQLKLGWELKAHECQQSAELFSKVATHAEYRLAMVESGGELKDSVEVWNTALTTESKEVTVLEMKELNERQRAEHATRMYNKLKSSVDDVEHRNMELEQKFAELTKLNLAAQQTERELRDELAGVVPKSVSDADRKKLSSLEEERAKAKVKISQLQDMSDIAHNQLRSVQSQQQAREREMKSLRQQVRDFQVQSDQNQLIGQLNHQILNLQASEVDAQRKLEVTQKDIRKLQALVIKLEKQIDEKEDAVYLTRTESSNKIRQLRKTIQSLRQQFSGALPISQQEKFSKSMIRLQEDKVLIQDELKRTRREREKLEDKLAETEIKQQGLEELKKAIEDARGAEKLTEWSRRMDMLRLQDLKLQRQVVRQNEQIKYVEGLNTQHEKTIASLEEDVVEMLKSQEEHQLEWELREAELERLLEQFQSRQIDVVRKARRLEDITQTLPDPSLPLDRQLSQALETIKEQMKIMKDLQAQIKGLELENDRLKDARHNLQGDVMSRDRVINELRLHMPTTASVITTASSVDMQSKQQLHISLETIETFKKRLTAKDESLSRYKQLLEDARKENESLVLAHEKELLVMQKTMQGKTDAAFSKFKHAAMGAISASRSMTSSSRIDHRHVSELEDMIKEQDAAMSALMDRIRAANADVTKQKRLIANMRNSHEAEKRKMQAEHDNFVSVIRKKLAKKHKRVDELEKELEVVGSELERQKEANARAPATTMKNLVTRLKVQLEEKEHQQQKLSHALTELRSDLVNQAQENVRAAAADEKDTSSVKQLVEKRTAHYKTSIEELKDEIAELHRGMKQAKRNEDTLKMQLKKILEETERKEQSVTRLKMDNRSLNSDIAQLRDKVKRLSKNRGPGSGLQFGEDKPTKLLRDDQSSENKERKKEKTKVVEEQVVAVDATSETTSGPLSGRSKVPRSVYKSSSVSELEKLSKLRAENWTLKEEIENLKEKLKQKLDEPSKSTVEVAKWDAKKQWQGKVDALKGKLQEKEKHAQVFEKQITSLRDTVARLEREKLRLQSIGGKDSEIGAVTVSEQTVRNYKHEVENLSHRLHQLGDENNELRRMNVLPRDRNVTEMDVKNKHLEEKLEAVQKELLTTGMRQEKDQSLAEQFRERENRLQARVLKLASDSTEIQFELELVKKDVPRLKERVEHQQQYIDLLQSEKRDLEQRLDKLKSQSQRKQPTSSSGKSVTELEKTVVLMKKVVERVQRENEQLKKAPGVVSNQVIEQFKSENQVLKNRINEMTQQIGGQLSMRYESKTQSVDRLVRENERIRKDLDKQTTIREKLKNSNIALQTERDSLVKELDEMKKKLSIAESKAPKFAGSGSRGYNSAVTSKMLESRLKTLGNEIEKKNSELDFLRSELKEKGSLEAEMRKDNERLHEQIEILERFPPGAGGSDPAVVRELQLSRLTVARLESEKDELLHELKVVKKRTGGLSSLEDAEPSTSHQRGELLDRSENIRLGTEVKKLEHEKRKLNAEVDRLQGELAQFNDDFFDEIEDLKYNYAEAVKRNVTYEEQLRAISKQFGVSFDIPSSDD